MPLISNFLSVTGVAAKLGEEFGCHTRAHGVWTSEIIEEKWHMVPTIPDRSQGKFKHFYLPY